MREQPTLCVLCFARDLRRKAVRNVGPCAQGVPLCRKCWDDCARRAAAPKPPVVAGMKLTDEELMVRRAAKIMIENPAAAGFEGIAALVGPMPGDKVH
jgi:hypothetical protein